MAIGINCHHIGGIIRLYSLVMFIISTFHSLGMAINKAKYVVNISGPSMRSSIVSLGKKLLS